MIHARITQLFMSLSCLALFACSQSVQDPKSVADRYWQNLQVGNTVEAEKMVSLNSRYTFSDIKDSMPAITQVTNGDAETIVKTTVISIGPDNQTQTQSFNTVLVLEQGEWKVDVNRSQMPPFADPQENSGASDSLESIDRALTDSMQKLNDALKEGSKEMGESLKNLMDELNNSMQESIDRLKQRREQSKPEDLQDNQTPPANREGVI